MVSLWPFKGDDSASFERTLSTLTGKIKRANVKQDKLRAASRRYMVLWTLYTSLAYLLTAIVLVLVTGWRNWGPVEYTVVAGSPVVIYGVRTTLTAFYDYRISSNQSYLNGLNRQREEAIEKFKSATKYNSTQELLEKYGAAPKSPSVAESPNNELEAKGKPKVPNLAPQRTGIPPPATANIRRPSGAAISQPSSPMHGRVASNGPTPISNQAPFITFDSGAQASPVPPSTPGSPQSSTSFLPNNYQMAAAPQYSAPSQPQWYDRIIDLILGEDEQKASNRVALICQYCRLVNGQAPPGVKSLHEVGRWRCAECRRWNGVESEMQQIVKAATKGGASIELIGEPGPEITEHIEAQDEDAESSIPGAPRGEIQNSDVKKENGSE